MLPPEAIKQFKEIYLKIYGVELADEEASLRANNLVNLYEAVYGDFIMEKHGKHNEQPK